MSTSYNNEIHIMVKFDALPSDKKPPEISVSTDVSLASINNALVISWAGLNKLQAKFPQKVQVIHVHELIVQN